MATPGAWRIVAWILSALVLSGAANARAGWTGAERLALAQSGRVDPALIEALDAAPEAPVIVVLALPAGVERRRARAEAADAALAGLRPGDLQLSHRYGEVSALAGRLRRGGLLRLLAGGHVLRVGLDAGVRAQMAEAVPMTGMDQLHVEGHDGAGQVVAVIDTGVESAHTALAGAVIAEQCFCLGLDGLPGAGCCPNLLSDQSGAGAAADDHGHGTRVAGIVASNGNTAPLGGAPGASLVAVKTLDATGSGHFADVISALNWILAERPDVTVVNMSLGGGLYSGDCDAFDATTMALSEAIGELRDLGVPSVAGSGNDGSGTAMIAPACVADALSVSAVWDADVGGQSWHGCTDSSTYPDLVTCWGNSGTTTDLFAPGALIRSAKLGGGHGASAGTSYATPVVSGCAALMLAAQPGLHPDVLEGALGISPTRVTDPKNGLEFPRLECAAALGAVWPISALPPILLPVVGLAVLGAARGLLSSRA